VEGLIYGRHSFSSSRNNVQPGIHRLTRVEMEVRAVVQPSGPSNSSSCQSPLHVPLHPRRSLQSMSILRPVVSALVRRGLTVGAALGISAFPVSVWAIRSEGVIEGIRSSTAQLLQRPDDAMSINTRAAQTSHTNSDLTQFAKITGGWEKEIDPRTQKTFYVNHGLREWSWEPPLLDATANEMDVHREEKGRTVHIAGGVGGVAVAVGAAGMGVVALQRGRLQDESLSKQDTYTTTARGGGGGHVTGAAEEALAAARREVAAAKQDAQVAIKSST